MSAIEDSSRNINDENTPLNQDGGSLDTKIRSDGNVLSLDPKNSKNMEQTVQDTNRSPDGSNKDSGDATAANLNKQFKNSHEMESENFIVSDTGKVSGDYSANASISDETDQKVVISNTEAVTEEEENDGLLVKDNILDLEKGDEDIEDDDITLRWDDDEGSQPLDNDNGNSEILSESQLLEDTSDNILKETTADNTEGNLEDNSNDDADCNVHNTDKNTKDIETANESVCSSKQDIPSEKNNTTNIDSILEDELLEETEVTKDEPNEEMEEDVNDLENELLEDLNTDASEQEVVQKSIEENEERIEDSPTNKESKESVEDILLSESENAVETEATVFTIKSDKDAITNPESEEVDFEDVLLQEADAIIESSGIIPDESNTKDLEDSEEALLEDIILEEIKTAEQMLESDITMDVDDETEREFLKDDESQDITTPMDVDNEESTENLAKVQEEIDQPINDQSTLAKAGIESPLNSETVSEDINKDITIEDKDKDQIDDYKTSTETICDQSGEEQSKTEPIEHTKTEETIQDKVVDEKTEDGENAKDKSSPPLVTPIDSDKSTQIDDQEKSLPEKENDLPTIEDKTSTENVKEITETLNKDTNLDKTIENADISTNNTSIFLEDSPVHMNTKHSLHKPDVMLEIPTQELIDIDDTDLSLNLDQSEILDATDDVEMNADEDMEEQEVKQHVLETDRAVTQDTTVGDTPASPKSIGDDELISKETIVEEKSVPQEALMTDPLTSQKSTATETTVNEKPTDTEKSVGQDTTVTEKAEVEVEKGIVKSMDGMKDKDTIPETIEESMEKMFADDEPAKEMAEATQDQQPGPSTSLTTMTPDTSDEVPEVSDSLGLLAESSGRVMEDDEEPEDDDDGDDDDDFDQDESSNQISAEQSEDSNPPVLESDTAGEAVDKEIDTPDPKDDQFQFVVDSVETVQEKADSMDVEESTVELPAVSINDEETKTAVDALLRDGVPEEQVEAPVENTEQMDIETVKLSDTSDNEGELQAAGDQTTVETGKDVEEKQASPSPSKSSPVKQSPSKMKKLEITTLEPSSVVNYVDLEESSSSEDDIQEIEKQPETQEPSDKPTSPEAENVTNVNIPTGIEIMCSGGSTSEILTKDKEVVISGVPKPPPHKPARLNTSEVSIKTASNTEPLVIPETTINDLNQSTVQTNPKVGLEIFNLDSDDEDSSAKEKPDTPHKMTALELEKARETSKCINYCGTNCSNVPSKVADSAVVAYYDAGSKRRSMVCVPCAQVVADRTKNLVEGIKNLTPLLELEMDKLSHDLVEISDSESEDEDTTPEEPKESIGEEGAKFLEDNLAKILNDTWKKYDMDTRLAETQITLDDEIEKLEKDSEDIKSMLNECQMATDKLRCELYATFQCRRRELPAVVLYDTPDTKFVGLESDQNQDTPVTPTDTTENRQAKRRLSPCSEVPAKRPAIPLGYTPLETPTIPKDPKAAIPLPDGKIDDDKDVSVVKLSVESAPADLPPPGEISRPPLRVSMQVYAMKNAFGPWLKGKVLEIQPKNPGGGSPFSLCRVKFDHKRQANGKVLPARCIAYSEPADVRMTIGTRLIALFKDSTKRESYYSGVVAEIPNPVNNYRYLVFFDDGYAQYVQHQHTRLVCESSPLVWEEVHPFSREFVKEYLLAYPERPMVRLHEGQHLKTEWNGKWWSSRVTKVDASLAQVLFVGDGRREWIYRGSTRLAPLYLELRAAERHRPRPMPRSKAQPRLNMPYVEYTRSDEQEPSKQTDAQAQQQQQQQNEEIRRQRAVAKKSTAVPQPPVQPPGAVDTVTSRVVYYTPKNAVKPYKMTPHKCGPKCKRSDVLSLKELRTYNPLAKPLLSGWERQIVRFKGHKEVMYRAPCGRRLRNIRELHRYLRAVACELPVDLFDFHPATHCLAEFVLNKCRVGKKDLSHGKENVPVPCVNYYDESLPEFCSYNTERTPTAGVPLNLDPEFLCGCDCTDDCQDKTKCACWKMTLEGARTIGLEGPNVGYVYKRLPEPLPSGIYECNSRCKCKYTCLNRVAQHPLQLKLQVFKTLNRGWGIRALNDVPKGSFLCVYAGNLLTDATANLDGLNEGDEYLAELDYIEVVEQMKEGYEEDIPEADKKLDKKEAAKDGEATEDELSPSEDEGNAPESDKEDDDFRPGSIGLGVMEFNKRLRKREKKQKDKEKSATDKKEKEKDGKDKDSKDAKESNADEDCITISDDEEVREPSRFNVQAGMGASEFISKYKSVRTLFGKDEACYIMDAKVQGNIGRYLNHSCCPNVFVQNVFVDTHDPRFPWVAFFALSHIKAGTELTWNYNYDVGSVPGKILYCHCGAPNCRGRLL